MTSKKSRKILFLSLLWVGRAHDFTIFKEEFDRYHSYLRKLKIWVDLGFKGIAAFLDSLNIIEPAKASKNKPLDDAQKAANRTISGDRVPVEHSIGGIKKYRLIYERIRTKLDNNEFLNTIVGICAGLFNFQERFKVLNINL